MSDISKYHVRYGSVQNRMEHAVSVNNIASENLQTAESKIRDTDMAKEMIELSKNNILIEAGMLYYHNLVIQKNGY